MDVLYKANDIADKRAKEKLESTINLLEKCPEDRRKSVAAAIRILHPEYVCLPSADFLDSSYPNASADIQAKIVLGKKPTEIFKGLTKAEAHEYLSSNYKYSEENWLLEKHGINGVSVRSVKVAKWLINALKDPQRTNALKKHRIERGPYGEEIGGCWLDRVDELKDCDLVTSVEKTFANAGKRLMREVEREMSRKSEPLAPPPTWWKPARCATLLLSAAQLVQEGAQMHHCVATYAGYVKQKKSVIIALNVCGHRSTADIDRSNITIRQHRGMENNEPHELCKKALNVLVRRWSK